MLQCITRGKDITARHSPGCGKPAVCAFRADRVSEPAMTHAPAPLITADGLALERGGRLLLREIALSAGPGEALILHGPNGSGKTTLLRALAGLVRPVEGRISRARDEDTAFLGHADALKPAETVIEALTFWAGLYGADRLDIEAALTAFAISHLERRSCARLSAGQRRRVALARVAMSKRPLWLLDEPAAPLDAKGRTLLAAAVADHCAAGGAVVAATHIDMGWRDARVMELAL